MNTINPKGFIDERPLCDPESEHLRSYRVLIGVLKWELSEKEKELMELEARMNQESLMKPSFDEYSKERIGEYQQENAIKYPQKEIKEYSQHKYEGYSQPTYKTLDRYFIVKKNSTNRQEYESPIKLIDPKLAAEERYRYYRTKNNYAKPAEYRSEAVTTSIRELYKDRVFEKDPRPKVERYSQYYDPSPKADIKIAKDHVEEILGDLKSYKQKCEELAGDIQKNDYQKEVQEPQLFITEDQAQEFLAQCKELERQIDTLQEKYRRILNKVDTTSPVSQYIKTPAA